MTDFKRQDEDTRIAVRVAKDLVDQMLSGSSDIGYVWCPGDATEYRVALSRVATGNYRGDHVLHVVVGQEAYSVFLPSPWHTQPSAELLRHRNAPPWLWPAVNLLIRAIDMELEKLR